MTYPKFWLTIFERLKVDVNDKSKCEKCMHIIINTMSSEDAVQLTSNSPYLEDSDDEGRLEELETPHASEAPLDVEGIRRNMAQYKEAKTIYQTKLYNNNPFVNDRRWMSHFDPVFNTKYSMEDHAEACIEVLENMNVQTLLQKEFVRIASRRTRSSDTIRELEECMQIAADWRIDFNSSVESEDLLRNILSRWNDYKGAFSPYNRVELPTSQVTTRMLAYVGCRQPAVQAWFSNVVNENRCGLVGCIIQNIKNKNCNNLINLLKLCGNIDVDSGTMWEDDDTDQEFPLHHFFGKEHGTFFNAFQWAFMTGDAGVMSLMLMHENPLTMSVLTVPPQTAATSEKKKKKHRSKSKKSKQDEATNEHKRKVAEIDADEDDDDDEEDADRGLISFNYNKHKSNYHE